MAFIKGADRNQKMMLPEYIEDYVTEDNPVRVIDEYVDTIDFKDMGFTKIRENRPGAPGYHPSILMKLYLYGYLNGIRSSRKLENEAKRNLELIWLLGKLQPDFKTISDFRMENKKNLRKIFKEFSLFCRELGLYGGTLIAVDGTKIKANNSKRNNYNQKKIDRQVKYIDEKTEEYLRTLENNDSLEVETEKYSAQELRGKIKILKERRESYKKLEEELKKSEETQISTVDPDSRLMENKKNGLEMGYNLQISVDAKNKLVLDFDVTKNPADQGSLNSMSQKSKEALGKDPKDEIEVLADKGYYQGEDLKKCEENNTRTYVSKQTYANATGNKEFYTEKFVYDKEKDLYICPAGKELKRLKHRVENPKEIRYKNYEECNKCEYRDKCTKSKKVE